MLYFAALIVLAFGVSVTQLSEFNDRSRGVAERAVASALLGHHGSIVARCARVSVVCDTSDPRSGSVLGYARGDKGFYVAQSGPTEGAVSVVHNGMILTAFTHSVDPVTGRRGPASISPPQVSSALMQRVSASNDRSVIVGVYRPGAARVEVMNALPPPQGGSWIVASRCAAPNQRGLQAVAVPASVFSTAGIVVEDGAPVVISRFQEAGAGVC